MHGGSRIVPAELRAEPCVRRVNYTDLSAFQRGLFDAHGELYGFEVTDAPASALAAGEAV